MNNRIVNGFYTIIAALTFTIGAAVTSKVYAAESMPSETVSYSDLNLSTFEGQATFNQRVRAAAKRVCRNSGGSDAFGSLKVRACERRAEAQAMSGEAPRLARG